MRGSFGGAPPAGPTELVAAQPEDACTQLTNADDVKGKVVVAWRGTCTFGTKATIAEAAGAAGLIIVNNAEGNLHPPMPDAVDVQVFVAMVAKPAGNVVIKVRTRIKMPHISKYDASVSWFQTVVCLAITVACGISLIANAPCGSLNVCHGDFEHDELSTPCTVSNVVKIQCCQG
eukprot:TRINITY_DN1253_c0_g1_i3.p1 TRINITY_DN1253_c0_g1~~TRINITY_DN1253_c0_g1_i3.p1  ORF type:complete len:175 (+),score=20.65 TRINITY_DN1253_c0_g1_i3:2308-2832(+)